MLNPNRFRVVETVNDKGETYFYTQEKSLGVWTLCYSYCFCEYGTYEAARKGIARYIWKNAFVKLNKMRAKKNKKKLIHKYP